jgi:hypothetical protein
VLHSGNRETKRNSDKSHACPRGKPAVKGQDGGGIGRNPGKVGGTGAATSWQ